MYSLLDIMYGKLHKLLMAEFFESWLTFGLTNTVDKLTWDEQRWMFEKYTCA